VTESPPTSINLERAAHKKLHTLAAELFLYMKREAEKVFQQSSPEEQVVIRYQELIKFF
jgi:hypothetical protein